MIWIKSNCISLKIIFKSCLTQDIVPSKWKKANTVPIHKKNNNKKTNSVLKTTDLSFFSQSVARFSDVLFITRCSHILQKTSSYPKLNLVILLNQLLGITFCFFYLGFLSRTFTNHRTAGKGGGHSINSSLPPPPASQTLRH